MGGIQVDMNITLSLPKFLDDLLIFYQTYNGMNLSFNWYGMFAVAVRVIYKDDQSTIVPL